MKRENVHWVYYGGVVVVAMGMKFLHAISATDDLLWLLGPVDFIVRVFVGESSVYIPGEGYYFESAGILIDRSCAGVNFLIITFCTLTTISLPFYTKSKTRIGLFTGTLPLAYCLTVVTNASRILGALRLLSFKVRFPVIGTSWFHEAQGALFYLTSLLLCTLLLNYFNKQIHFRYAKSS